MNVLVVCEYSARVRDAFRAKGHNAWSCDLLPTEGDPRWHYQEDCFEAIKRQEWDLMIAHPPCTYLSNAGNGYFNVNRYGSKALERHRLRLEAMEFVQKLWKSPIEHICIENPVGYLNKNWQKPTQIIQPFYFGDSEYKTTCLWLKNLPKLNATNLLDKPKAKYIDSTGKARHFTDSVSGQDRQKLRSKTFQGIATAMAEQWGK